MQKRKQYLIDKKFQLRTTFSIMGIVTIITTVILGVIIAIVIINSTTIDKNNKKIERIHEIEDNVVAFLTSRPVEDKDIALKNAMKTIAGKHYENMRTLRKIIESQKMTNKINMYLLLSVIIIILAEGLLLYFMLIRKTHRVSGPIHVMSKYMKDIIDGKIPKLRPLRTKDELKDFYELFSKMVDSLKDK